MFEKWTVEVDFLCVLTWVPVERPPAFLTVDGVFGVFLVEGNNVCSAFFTRVVIEVAFVTPGEPALEAAGWAEGWGGDFEAFVKRLVLLCDFKGGGAVFAGFFGHFLNFTQIFLKRGKLEVESMNAAVGTIEFKYGSGRFDIRKKTKITRYVSPSMMMRLVQLVSQALSSSTRWFRSFRASISFWSWVIVGMINLDYIR